MNAFIFSGILAVISGIIAFIKHRNASWWAILTFILGFFSFIPLFILLFLKTKNEEKRILGPMTNKKVSDPKITVSISTSSSQIENPDTGSITSTGDSYVLNPKSTFPLTISGVDQTTAEKLKKLLEDGYNIGAYAHARTLMPVITRSNLRCKEINDYIKTFKPQYLSKIEDLKQSSQEWTLASEKDREDLLVSFRQQAIEGIDIRPCCNLEVLFECEPADTSIDDALIDRFGFENLQLYLRNSKNLNKIRVIPADHYDRHGFEELVKLGLAIRGTDIPLPNILETLKLKDINDLAVSLNQEPFKRKSKAIEFLLSLPDAQQRASKLIAFRELFQLKPLPGEFSNIELNKISNAWSYAFEIAFLIAHTYTMGGYATRSARQHQKMLADDESFVKGWELVSADDSCPYCKNAALKLYHKNQHPKTPLHIGCRCAVLPKLKEF